MAVQAPENSSMSGMIDIGAKAVANVVGILGCVSENQRVAPRLDIFLPERLPFKLGAIAGLGVTAFQAIRGIERVAADTEDIGGWLLLASGVLATAAILAGFGASSRSDLSIIFSIPAYLLTSVAALMAPGYDNPSAGREALSILSIIPLMFIYPSRLRMGG